MLRQNESRAFLGKYLNDPRIPWRHKRREMLAIAWIILVAKWLAKIKRQSDVGCSMTSESRGDVTRDSLGDVTWSHGTHDVKRSVGKVRRIWMRKQQQEGQTRIVMSTRGFLLLWFRIHRNRSSDRSSSTQAIRMPARACVREGARWSPSSR